MPDKQNKPIENKEEIRKHPDGKIDQDFKNIPSGPAKEEVTNPKTAPEETVAPADARDGEKINIPPSARKSLDEQESDGSANAFDDK